MITIRHSIVCRRGSALQSDPVIIKTVNLKQNILSVKSMNRNVWNMSHSFENTFDAINSNSYKLRQLSINEKNGWFQNQKKKNLYFNIIYTFLYLFCVYSILFPFKNSTEVNEIIHNFKIYHCNINNALLSFIARFMCAFTKNTIINFNIKY